MSEFVGLRVDLRPPSLNLDGAGCDASAGAGGSDWVCDCELRTEPMPPLGTLKVHEPKVGMVSPVNLSELLSFGSSILPLKIKPFGLLSFTGGVGCDGAWVVGVDFGSDGRLSGFNGRVGSLFGFPVSLSDFFSSDAFCPIFGDVNGSFDFGNSSVC